MDGKFEICFQVADSVPFSGGLQVIGYGGSNERVHLGAQHEGCSG